LARVVAPAPRTGTMSTSQSIRAFADDARASLAALDAALGSKAAVALLRRGGALDWADAVIPSADLAVERAMLDAPAAVAGTEGPASGRADAGCDAEARPIGLLPAPGEARGARASKREASASKTAARDAESRAGDDDARQSQSPSERKRPNDRHPRDTTCYPRRPRRRSSARARSRRLRPPRRCGACASATP
jgi:hypothetical protein